jgi:hypothetical protein
MDSVNSEPMSRHFREVKELERRLVARVLKRLIDEMEDEEAHEITRCFLQDPSIDGVDWLCISYGARMVLKVLLLDSLIFEEFFYGKAEFYPVWIKRYARLIDATVPKISIGALRFSEK